MELLLDPQARIAFLTLTALELVLGIDNIIFISILVDRLPAGQREAARHIGLVLAMFMRIALLVTLAWIIGLTVPLAHRTDVTVQVPTQYTDIGALTAVQISRDPPGGLELPRFGGG